MNPNQDEVCAWLNQNQVRFRLATQEQVESIISRVDATFCDGNLRDSVIWERLASTSSYYEEERWVYLKNSTSRLDGEITFLIADWYRMSAIYIENMKDFYEMVAEGTYSMVWYAINSDWTYLACENDHNFVIVVDRAAGVPKK